MKLSLTSQKVIILIVCLAGYALFLLNTYQSKKIEVIDVNSEGVLVKDNSGRSDVMVAISPVDSFSKIYKRDKTVFFNRSNLKNESELIELTGADADTITYVSDFFIKDKNSVYVRHNIIGDYRIIEGLDPATFKIVSKDEYIQTVKDDRRVYYVGDFLFDGVKEISIFDGANPATFEEIILNNSYGGLGAYGIYFKDDKHFWELNLPGHKGISLIVDKNINDSNLMNYAEQRQAKYEQKLLNDLSQDN